MAQLTERFEEALPYAARIHAGDVRKGSEVPYVSHVLAVCALVLEDGGDEDEAIAALLHDAGEDAGGRERVEEIRERFGGVVARIVEECSDTLETPKPPWRERKEAYLAHLEAASPEAIRVSLADKVHNARSLERDQRAIGDDFWRRFNASRDDVLWYYRELAGVYAKRSTSPMVDELERTLDAVGGFLSTPESWNRSQ
jgi:(p)ppGpp synthase/HD superfamily hydrolase